MMVFCFFVAVFSSASWLIYAGMFVFSKLGDSRLWEQSFEQMLLALAVVFLPVFVIWMVFGLINQFLINRSMNAKQSELLTQLQKNQDYTDLVVRVMLDAEHEIKDGFVINKFDLFVSDMNEALSEIIQRCNIASSAQIEQLWQRVKRGERWVLGKAILDASKSQSTFDAWVREKVNRDKVFRGTMLEFCSRYQNLLQLLEKHDRDRIFLRIIETGVFGKVYSIIAPLSEGLGGLTAGPSDRIPQSKPERDYSSVLKIATMEEPAASETIVNVDKNDEEEEFPQPKTSVFSRLNPFGRRKNFEEDDDHERDPFFKALHNSFQDDGHNEDILNNGKTDNSVFEKESEPSLGTVFGDSVTEQRLSVETTEQPAPSLDSDRKFFEDRVTPTFGSVQNTLDSLRSSNDSFSAEIPEDKRTEPNLSTTSVFSQEKTSNKAVNSQTEKEEDLAYPFGGWTDEENYR